MLGKRRDAKTSNAGNNSDNPIDLEDTDSESGTGKVTFQKNKEINYEMLLDSTDDEAYNEDTEMEDNPESHNSEADNNIIEINDIEMQENEDLTEPTDENPEGTENFLTPDRDESGPEYKNTPSNTESKSSSLAKASMIDKDKHSTPTLIENGSAPIESGPDDLNKKSPAPSNKSSMDIDQVEQTESNTKPTNPYKKDNKEK